jgi:hypothetical protein
MAYYTRYVTGMKKVVCGVSLLQLVWLGKKPCGTPLLCASLACLLWLNTTSVSLNLTKRTPWVLVIIDPWPYGFASDFQHLSFICFAEQWRSMLTPHWSLLPSASSHPIIGMFLTMEVRKWSCLPSCRWGKMSGSMTILWLPRTSLPL